MKILQIFSRYAQFAGEEASVEEIGRALRRDHDVQTFYSSTREVVGQTLFSKLQAPFKAVMNWNPFAKLRELQIAEQFDIWLIHNVFPGLSPAVYDAGGLGRVPVRARAQASLKRCESSWQRTQACRRPPRNAMRHFQNFRRRSG